jgi:hypothetical protein
VTEPWADDTVGLVRFPIGVAVRGRGLRDGLASGQQPTVGVYALGSPPVGLAWETIWIDWPDFRLPRSRTDAVATLRTMLKRAETERVEVCCHGGQGRTGTSLAVMAVLSGVAPADAVDWVRSNYRPHAVETPGQRRWVRSLRP